MQASATGNRQLVAGMRTTRQRRHHRRRSAAWGLPQLSLLTFFASCGRLARSPATAAARGRNVAAQRAPEPQIAFLLQSRLGARRRKVFVPHWLPERVPAAAATRSFGCSCGTHELQMPSSMPLSLSSGELQGGAEVARPPTKRKRGRPKEARNKRPSRGEGGIYSDTGADELKRLVELAKLNEKRRLEGSGDGGRESGEDVDGLGRGNMLAENEVEMLAAEERFCAGRGSAVRVSRKTNREYTGFDGNTAADYGEAGDPRSARAEEAGGIDQENEASIGYDDDLPFDAEIRDAEERLRELRVQQQQHLEDERRKEGKDKLDREAAAMDAAVAAMFGRGKLPSDLLRAGKERERLKRGAAASKPGDPQQQEDEDEEDEVDEEEGTEPGEEGEEAREEQGSPAEPRLQRIPPIRYRRRRRPKDSNVEGSNSSDDGEGEFEEFVVDDASVPEEGDELPTASFLMERLDHLLSLEPDPSDTRVRIPEEELDDETARLMQMSEDDPSFNPELRQVLVVIGKHLIGDQVTVEYASRIRRLVQGLKSGRLQPDLVCFTGGVVRDNNIADATAGYIFFRHLCEQHKVRTQNIKFLVESKSTCTKEAMENVVQEVARLEMEALHAREVEEEDEEGEGRHKYHFTLISNEYHLGRIIEVHRLSEGVSLLAPLKQLDASWGYEQVDYPYACYNSETTRFQADVYKTLEELVPLQVNVQAVASREEFFHEENFASLVHVRAKLKGFIQQVQSSRGPRARNSDTKTTDLQPERGGRRRRGNFSAAGSSASKAGSMPLGEALQWAAGALDKMQEIIEPATTRRNSVSLRAWAMCAALLERAILQAQMAADPDRPLTATEWGVLEDEKPPREEVVIDEDKLIAWRARERVLAHLEEIDRRGGMEDADDDDDDDDAVDAAADSASRAEGDQAEGEVGKQEGGGGEKRERWDPLSTRRDQDVELHMVGEGPRTIHFAGVDARKELSLDNDDDPFDIHLPAWRGRLTPIDIPDDDGFPDSISSKEDNGREGGVGMGGEEGGGNWVPPPPPPPPPPLSRAPRAPLAEGEELSTIPQPVRSLRAGVENSTILPCGKAKPGEKDRAAASEGAVSAPKSSSAQAPLSAKRRRGRPRKKAAVPTEDE